MIFLISALGLVFGSFNTVLISRLPEYKSILGRSCCPECGYQIPFYLNIPIIGYLAVRGKCKNCSSPIPTWYPLVEIATMFFTVVVVSKFDTILGMAIGFIFASFSVALSIIDWREHRLPNSLTYALFLILLSLSITQFFIESLPLKQILISSSVMFVFYLALNIITRGGMGMGDVKYAASIGLVVGQFGYIALYLANMSAFFLGAVYGLFVMALGRGGRKSKVAFGPFMFLGAVTALCLAQILPSPL